MTKILCLILFSYACLTAQEQTVEPLPEIPDKTSKHKTISDVITSKNILRIISIKSPFSKTEKLFLTSELRMTSNNYRSKPTQVVQSDVAEGTLGMTETGKRAKRQLAKPGQPSLDHASYTGLTST